MVDHPSAHPHGFEIGIVHGDQPFQVDTPSVSVRANDEGDYRITVNRDGSSWVTARRGNAEVITPQRTYDLSPGRTLVARGSAQNPSISYRAEVGFDSFDDFNAKRDLYSLLAELAGEGIAIVMLSTELDEHLELTDRVLVFREQELACEIKRDELSRQALVSAFFGEDIEQETPRP